MKGYSTKRFSLRYELTKIVLAMKRRTFLIKLMTALSCLALFPNHKASAKKIRYPRMKQNPRAVVYRSINGKPSQNLSKVFELMGGIDQFIGLNDVVAIKPNVQWWNHGVPNLLVVKTLVEEIFNRKGGFNGEVVIVENVHRGKSPWQHAGWAKHFDLNSDIDGINNFNDLCGQLKHKYGERFSNVHLINVKSGGKRVYNPTQGAGYVYCDGTGGQQLIEMDNGVSGDGFRKVIMTYPIFKTDKGTVVDFKNGVWESGAYSTENKFRFINLAGINHHSKWCGISSTIKNYLGISDLSGGPDPYNDGKLIDNYYNFHSFPFDKWAPGPRSGIIGAEIGMFMNTIRRADLNIVSAEWVGLANRITPPVAHTRCVAASIDPVALDYHCSKYILHSNSKVTFHDPDNKNSPVHQYIKTCADHGGGIFDESQVELISYDHNAGRMQQANEAAILGKINWGNNLKTIGKYILMRYGTFLSAPIFES